MQNFLQFLMYKTKSVDGIPGSLNKWIKVFTTKKDASKKGQNKMIRTFSMFKNNDNMSQSEKDKIADLTKDLYRQAFKKFKLLRIRMKISYEAFIKENTILELFMRAI